MHYYKRNLGDYAKKAGRLSMLQHGAYTLLIDSCYDREVFPTLEEAIDWTWASSKEEVEAVEFVLSKFFTLQDDGTYVQQRIEEELEAYKITGLINQLVALSREAKKKSRQSLANSYDSLRVEIKDAPLSKSHAAWTSVIDALISQHETAPNQEPLTKNHKPITKNQDKKINKKEVTVKSEVIAFDEFWNIWPKKTAKADAEKAWAKLKPDQALFRLIADHLVTRRAYGCAEKKFIPNPATYLNGKRWNDEVISQFQNSGSKKESFMTAAKNLSLSDLQSSEPSGLDLLNQAFQESAENQAQIENKSRVSDEQH